MLCITEQQTTRANAVNTRILEQFELHISTRGVAVDCSTGAANSLQWLLFHTIVCP